MFKKRISYSIGLIIITALVLAVSGCGGGNSGDGGSQGGTTYISIGTASSGGSFYPVGVGMADVLNKNVAGVKAVAEETGGSVDNLRLVANGNIEIGFSPGDTIEKAINGVAPFEEKTEVKLGWVLFLDPIQPFALKESGIKSFYDLKGKRISAGTVGSTANDLTLDLLRAHGIDPEKDVTFTYLDWGESADALADKKIDAAVFMSAIPAGAIQGLAVRKPIQVIEADPQAIEEYFQGRSVYAGVMPAGSYDGQDEDAAILCDNAYTFFQADMSEDLVYEITKAVFENRSDIEAAHSMAKNMTLPDKELADKLSMEFHPGVIKYAQEVGAWE